MMISKEDFGKYGCPYCNCITHKIIFNSPDRIIVRCINCKESFTLPHNDTNTFIKEHPRHAKPFMYKAPDLKPENGEFFIPRGIGYDLAGFVTSKEAGERIDNIVKSLVGENKLSYLDYRENEPNHIQYKFNNDEFNLNLIYGATMSEPHILTEEILKEALQIKIEYWKDKFIKDNLKNPLRFKKECINNEILLFISNLLYSQGLNKNVVNTIHNLYSCGYCYYLAVMLKDAFPGGEIVCCAPYSHIAYKYNNVVYDINGICNSEAEYFIPISYISDGIYVLKHIPDKDFNVSKEFIEKAIDKYKKDRLNNK